MISIRDLSYSNPEAIEWLGLLPLILLLFAFLFIYQQKKQRQLAADDVLRRVAKTASPLDFLLRLFLITACFIFAAIALMGPRGNPRYPEGVKRKSTWEEEKPTLKQKAHEVLFLIDTSTSMAATDTSSGKPRLEQAKEVADEIVSRLKGETVSLTAFTSEPIELVPETLDTFFFRLQLKNLSYNASDISGTSLKKALQQASHESEGSSTKKSIILITDGSDNTLEELSEEDKKAWVEELVLANNHLRKDNTTLYIIAVGSEKGATIPDKINKERQFHSASEEMALKWLAAESGGSYFSLDKLPLLTVVDRIIDQMQESDPYVKEVDMLFETPGPPALIYDLYYQYPLFMAALLLGLDLFYFPLKKRRSR